jgi:hypothetical protein
MSLLLAILLIKGLHLSAWWYLVAAVVWCIQASLAFKGATTQLGALSYLMEKDEPQSPVVVTGKEAAPLTEPQKA